MANLIEVNNVYKAFGKGESMTKVLSGASLNVAKGEFVSLMGASGSGKSTLLYLIGGLDRKFDGTISVCGSDISKLKEKQIRLVRKKRIKKQRQTSIVTKKHTSSHSVMKNLVG